MKFKKGRDLNKLSTYVANVNAKPGIIMHGDGNKVQYLAYMIVLDFEEQSNSQRIKDVQTFVSDNLV